MKVRDLIAKLQKCNPESVVEDTQGVEQDLVWEHAGMKRVELQGQDDRPEVIALGWDEITDKGRISYD